MREGNEDKKTEAFGAKTAFNEADVILIPAPWEATASYGEGAHRGPVLIKKASAQLDFFNPDFNVSYNHKIHFEPSDPSILSLNKQARAWAKKIQKNWKEDKKLNKKELAWAKKVNQASLHLRDWIYEKSLRVFKRGKIPAIIGGDHSVSEGLINLTGQKLKGKYGLLHIDAHADLRKSYQGFKHSHASVMFNVLEGDFPPEKLVQVAVRDLCQSEFQKIKEDPKIDCFFDREISFRLFSGESWSKISKQIISRLPSDIYISLDVDGLSWENAPGTGTPVPGGISFNQILYLLSEVRRQKKRLIAFDVVETAGNGPGEAFWNGNVSARLIYHLAGLALSAKGHF